jgi:hypothetical protein
VTASLLHKINSAQRVLEAIKESLEKDLHRYVWIMVEMDKIIVYLS